MGWDGGWFRGMGNGWEGGDFDRLRVGGLLKVLVGDFFLFGVFFFSVHEVVDTRRIFVFYFIWNL